MTDSIQYTELTKNPIKNVTTEVYYENENPYLRLTYETKIGDVDCRVVVHKLNLSDMNFVSEQEYSCHFGKFIATFKSDVKCLVNNAGSFVDIERI